MLTIEEESWLGSQYLTGQCPICFTQLSEVKPDVYACLKCITASRYVKGNDGNYHRSSYERDVAACEIIIPRK